MYQPKVKEEVVDLGGVGLGISSDRPHRLTNGYVSELNNAVFKNWNARSRLGWNTISNGFAKSTGSFTDGVADGWNSDNYGTFVDYLKNDVGKVILFQKYGFCDTSTSKPFANATSFTFARQDSKDWLGVVYFADTWLLYNELKLYSLNTATGALTSQVVWASDLGAEYSPIIKVFVRFGQLWVVTKGDRIFWSRTRRYTIGADTPVTNEQVSLSLGTWQYLVGGKISAFTLLEGQVRADYTVVSAGGFMVKKGGTSIYVRALASDFSDGDEIELWYGGKQLGEQYEVSACEALQPSLYASSLTGSNFIEIAKDAGLMYDVFKVGDYITISDNNSSSEVHKITSVVVANAYYGIYIDGTLASDFTTAQSAKITHNEVVKVTIDSGTWDYSYSGGTFSGGNWVSLDVTKYVWLTYDSSHYDITLDPDNDDDAKGHIRIKDNPSTRNALAFRVSYTPYINNWTYGSAGYIDIAQSKGNNVAVVEGPDSQNQQGSGLLYLFKSNGDIYAIVGVPGADGSQGSLDIRFVAAGVVARPGTIQVTREGIYFGSMTGVSYNVYFIPHGDYSMAAAQVPKITDHFTFDVDIPFGNTSYTIYEKTAVLDGEMYLICFPNSTSGIPSTNGKIYVGRAYKDGEGIKGRWATWSESCELEYESGSSVTIPAGGAPTTQGFYLHDGQLCRVYTVKVGRAFSGVTRYYEIAQYGWLVGSEEGKDSYIYTKDNGDGTYTSAAATEFFWMTVKYGMTRIADDVVIRGIFPDVDIVGGSSGSGVDLTYGAYTDLDYTTELAGFQTSIADFTDDTAALRVLSPKLKCNVLCTYFQPYFRFDNIKYRAHPAYVEFRGLSAIVHAKAPKHKLSEEAET